MPMAGFLFPPQGDGTKARALARASISSRGIGPHGGGKDGKVAEGCPQEAQVWNLEDMDNRERYPHQPHPLPHWSAFYQKLQQNIHWWKKYAPLDVIELIQDGISAPSHLAHPLSQRGQKKTGQDILDAQLILQEYLEVGAVKLLNNTQAHMHLVPWFVIRKTELTGEKLRLISDCREINAYFNTQKFKLDHLQHIYPILKPGMWGAKIDLKHAYFHLPLHPNLRQYLHLQVGDQVWEFQAAPFGLNILPQLFTRVMHTFQKKWRKIGMLVYIYLDDILLLATTQKQAQKHLRIILQDLQNSGFTINQKKSHLQPCQELTHLGFDLDLKKGFLKVPPARLKSVRKELGKLVKKHTISVRKLASILGQIRSFLTALPFLRAFTNHFVDFLQQEIPKGWDHVAMIPENLKQEVLSLHNLLSAWPGRKFQQQNVHRHLAADSSTTAWAGLDLTGGHLIQEFWRNSSGLHINVKELWAALNTIRSLAKRNEKIHLQVDNSTTFWYLKKMGGRKHVFNAQLKPFILWANQQGIQIEVQLVKSADMPADRYTRIPMDKGDYTMDLSLFWHMWSIYRPFLTDYHQMVDMFSSVGNHKFPLFVTRQQHWQAIAVDALNTP